VGRKRRKSLEEADLEDGAEVPVAPKKPTKKK
jgi:hypothetical protein